LDVERGIMSKTIRQAAIGGFRAVLSNEEDPPEDLIAEIERTAHSVPVARMMGFWRAKKIQKKIQAKEAGTDRETVSRRIQDREDGILSKIDQAKNELVGVLEHLPMKEEHKAALAVRFIMGLERDEMVAFLEAHEDCVYQWVCRGRKTVLDSGLASDNLKAYMTGKFFGRTVRGGFGKSNVKNVAKKLGVVPV